MIGHNLGAKPHWKLMLTIVEHAVKVGGTDHVGLAADFAVQGWKTAGLHERIGTNQD